MKALDLTGQRFGKLTVISRTETRSKERANRFRACGQDEQRRRKMENEELVETVVFKLLHEITDRRGFKSDWYDSGEKIQQEIINAFKEIIESELLTKLEAGDRAVERTNKGCFRL
jgi:ribosomal protein L16 Arg81 hydroxylase